MKVDIYDCLSGKMINRGYIELDIAFNPEYCFMLCNWEACFVSKPQNLHSDISECGHGICFHNPENDLYYLALSIGFFVDTKEAVLSYVRSRQNLQLWVWCKEYRVGNKDRRWSA